MPALANPRHELFAQGVARGLSQRAAYEGAGYAARGRNAGCNARDLLRRGPEVKARIAELRDRAAGRGPVTLADVTATLLRIADASEAMGGSSGFAAARAALMDLAKLHGLTGGKGEGAGRAHEDVLAELGE